MSGVVELTSRGDGDLVDCLKALRHSHDVDRYPINWPEDPRAWLSPPHLLGAWVATLDQRLAGHIVLAACDGACAEIGRLFVTPIAQRRGVAVALLDAATNHAATLGRCVELNVVEDSGAAIRLYERLGWTLVGRAPAAFTWADGTRPVERRYSAPVRV